ncbi:MAG: magnesium and cobalt transport protein CorA [Actinomycetota bacterium]|nr:magnesium and cobalt transport protein CorA [Actinomycetota bacterium]
MIVDCAVYEGGRRREGALALEDTYERCGRDGAFAWIGLVEPTEEEFDSVRREFALHELAVEDAIKAHQRPKLETYGDSLFVVLKAARFVEEEGRLEFGEILVFVGDAFIVSVRHGGNALADARRQMEERPDLLSAGPSAALYAIIDHVVDDYTPVIEALDRAIQDVESAVFSADRSNPAARIYALKRAVLELHAAVVPLITPLEGLAAGRHPSVPDALTAYFRDAHDHVLRIAARTQEFRELLTSVLTANLTQASVAQNDDVRKISAWAAIIAVPTMIAGIYGMNFEHMPELEWRLGYPLVLLVIALVCVALYRRFRRAGWL